ncbi:hypothetical protein [Lactococcus lactis]|uniref:hypothetical protein n=1 Tax=Lactococcus lactis TaxID=1358 RepID=UPI000BA560F9|nr:hypothetical protein [Lactococcus lactis]PAL03024.1 hypothetical protein B8W91_08835 [Lactococcus lactis]
MKIAEKTEVESTNKVSKIIIACCLVVSIISIGITKQLHRTSVKPVEKISQKSTKKITISSDISGLTQQLTNEQNQNKQLNQQVQTYNNSIMASSNESEQVKATSAQLMKLLFNYDTKGNFSFSSAAQNASAYLSNESDIENIFGASNGSYSTIKQDIHSQYSNLQVKCQKLSEGKILAIVTVKRTMQQLNMQKTSNVVYYGTYNLAENKFDSLIYLASVS